MSYLYAVCIAVVGVIRGMSVLFDTATMMDTQCHLVVEFGK